MTISGISLSNDLLKLDTISHNIANLTTPGYKRSVVSTETFMAALNQIQGAKHAGDKNTQALISSAIPKVQLTTDLTAAALKHTGNPLDVGIEGDGYFEMSGVEGHFYTKRGNFTLDNRGRLSLSNSELIVNGMDGDIRLQSMTPEIDSLGRVFEGDTLVGQLRVVSFAQPDKLNAMGNGVFMAGEGAQPFDVELPAVRQAHIETSNTQPADEMMALVKLARHVEATQQVIRGYDGMMETALDDLGNF